ncbi:hypothetical protein F1559_004504 [Cyanidiococcus yangmingshanensis]|uniref:NAD(P)-binding domain-containing protein n=1 Tax=Cyanidiococcus yangmingshanensis TaxID=2690220 RepID=A0A7J7IJ48_9RHOD|nr:hypothetical protein F1559_004504 [Cyanidiococcus yangmingshanensis]
MGFIPPVTSGTWSIIKVGKQQLVRRRSGISPSVSVWLNMKRVLVVGGSGRLGKRIVRVLVEKEVPVLVGARDPQRAEETVRAYLREAGLSNKGDLQFVAHDLTEPAAVQAEKVFRPHDIDVVIDAAGPRRLTPLEPLSIDFKGNRELIRAACTGPGTAHFILVTALATGRFGWPAGLLNLAYGILFWKRRAELFLIDQVRKTAARTLTQDRVGTETRSTAASGGGIKQFTIVRPSGLERATDNWGDTHALRIHPADTLFKGSVSRLQVAQVCVTAALHPDASRNKIFELTTEEGPLAADLLQLMDRIPSLDVS